jgi:hypothetical protein
MELDVLAIPTLPRKQKEVQRSLSDATVVIAYNVVGVL